jgi:hypothetical protein
MRYHSYSKVHVVFPHVLDRMNVDGQGNLQVWEGVESEESDQAKAHVASRCRTLKDYKYDYKETPFQRQQCIERLQQDNEPGKDSVKDDVIVDLSSFFIAYEHVRIGMDLYI